MKPPTDEYDDTVVERLEEIKEMLRELHVEISDLKALGDLEEACKSIDYAIMRLS